MLTISVGHSSYHIKKLGLADVSFRIAWSSFLSALHILVALVENRPEGLALVFILSFHLIEACSAKFILRCLNPHSVKVFFLITCNINSSLN